MAQFAHTQLQQLEARIKEASAATDKVQKEYNALSEKVVKLHHDLEEQVHQNSQLMADNSARQVGGGWAGSAGRGLSSARRQQQPHLRRVNG